MPGQKKVFGKVTDNKIAFLLVSTPKPLICRLISCLILTRDEQKTISRYDFILNKKLLAWRRQAGPARIIHLADKQKFPQVFSPLFTFQSPVFTQWWVKFRQSMDIMVATLAVCAGILQILPIQYITGSVITKAPFTPLHLCLAVEKLRLMYF